MPGSVVQPLLLDNDPTKRHGTAVDHAHNGLTASFKTKTHSRNSGMERGGGCSYAPQWCRVPKNYINLLTCTELNTLCRIPMLVNHAASWTSGIFLECQVKQTLGLLHSCDGLLSGMRFLRCLRVPGTNLSSGNLLGPGCSCSRHKMHIWKPKHASGPIISGGSASFKSSSNVCSLDCF